MTPPKLRSFLRTWFFWKSRKSAWFYGRLITVVTLLFVCFNILRGRRDNQHVDETHPVQDDNIQFLEMRAIDEWSPDVRNETYPEIKLGSEFILNSGRRLLNNFSFDFVINQVNACDNSPEVVIIVISAASHHKRREAIRNTWASKDRPQTMTNRILFMVAVAGNDSQRNLQSESETYHDILQPDFLESYKNLPMKSVAILEWCIEHCMKSRFVVKVDDDVYVNIPVLFKLLQAQPHSDFILGKENFHTVVRRSSRDRYYVSKLEYPYAFYPPYLQGVGYVITTHALPLLYYSALHLPVVRLEDVYVTGFCRIRSGVSLIHTNLFKTGHKPKGCVVRYLALVHGYGRMVKVHRIHKEVTNTSLVCPSPKNI